MARFVELTPDAAGDAWVERVCTELLAGGILAHPTTSVYGIGGAGTGSDAVVSVLKGRSPSIPVLRLVFDAPRLRDLHPEIRWTEEAELLAAAFWPGPLTIVLDDGTDRGFAARAEAHPSTRAVLAGLPGSLGSTSLNLSGQPPARTMAEARSALGAMREPEAPLLLLAAGDLPGPPPSTLVSLRGGEPSLLREGAIHVSAIERALGHPLRIVGEL